MKLAQIVSLSGILFVLGLLECASGQNPNTSSYQYLTIYETTMFGELIKFLNGDTLRGPVHSNDTIGIMQSPVFLDTVSTSADLFWNGPGYNPQFTVPPVFNAPRVALPEQADALREAALTSGHFYDDNNGQWAHRLVFDGQNGWTLYWWAFGATADSILDTGPPLNGEVIWVDGYLELKGVVAGQGTVGARGNPDVTGCNSIRLLDDVRYWFADSLTGAFNDSTGGFTDMLGIVCEGYIVVANTWENGRENKSLGRDIVITAAMTALGESFTFEDQNDNFIWEFSSGYISPTNMDNRGSIFLHGSLAQYRRGYVHRNNHGAPGGGPPGDTGYGKHYTFDQRFSSEAPPGIPARHFPMVDPPALDFGNTQIGAAETLLVTLRNEGGTYIDIDTAWTTLADMTVLPVDSLVLEPGDSTTFQVVFAPAALGLQLDTLNIGLFYGSDLRVPCSGEGVALAVGPAEGTIPPETFSLFPNPFNEQIRISYKLPEKPVDLILYNLYGQVVANLPLSDLERTSGAFTWRPLNLPSGLYWLALRTTENTYCKKIVHLK